VDQSFGSKIRAANSALIVDGDLGAVSEFFTTDYVAHLTDREMRGHEAIRGFLRMLRGAFLNLQVDVEVLVEGKKRVAWQRTVKGIHQGNFMGFSASGREIVWRDMATSQFRDGLIVEEWVISDLAEHLLRARKP